jgi:uncharacterized membrane protein
MDPVLLHVRLNHFPIVLALAGAVAVLAGVLLKRTTLLRYAQISLIAAAVFAPVVYFSGDKAEHEVEEAWYADHDVIEEHEAAGKFAGISLVLTGIIAAFSLWKKDRRGWQIALLVFAVWSAAVVLRTGYLGGKIVHGNPAIESGDRSSGDDNDNSGRH